MKTLPKLIISAGHYHFFHRSAPLIAARKGYFKEEGIFNYEIMATGDDELTIEGLKNKNIHIGLDLKPEVVMRENLKGEKVYIIGAMINGLPLTLIAAKGIKSVADLKGKRINVVEKGGGIDARQIRALLRQHGFDPQKDVSWVLGSVPILSKLLAGLEHGDFEAVATPNPGIPQVMEKGYTVLCDFTKIYPHGYPQRVIVTTGDIIEQYPDMVKAFLKAIIRAYRFMRKEENFPEGLEIVKESVKERDLGWPEFDHSELKTQYLGFKIVPTDGNITKKGLEQMIAEDKFAGKLPPTYTMDQVVRLNFVEQAANELNNRFGPDGYN